MTQLPLTAHNDQPPAPVRLQEYRVPDHAKIACCSSCGAPIIWTHTSKNGRAIPLSVATIRTAGNAAQHRKHTQPTAINIDLFDLPAYLRARQLVVTSSKVSDNGDGWLHIELFTRSIT